MGQHIILGSRNRPEEASHLIVAGKWRDRHTDAECMRVKETNRRDRG